MLGVTPEDPPRGQRTSSTYLLGFHWDAPGGVSLGSLHLDVELLAPDAVTRVLEGSLDPATATVLPLEPTGDSAQGALGPVFWGPIAAGETRWYRVDTRPGDLWVTALFPWSRVDGIGLEGEFRMEMRNLDGEMIGRVNPEVPQLSQDFGALRYQAQVSGTTVWDSDPLPETVLIGFSWIGSGGESTIRFEVENNHDLDQGDGTGGTDAAEEETAETSDDGVAIGEDDPVSETAAFLPIAIGIAAVGLLSLLTIILFLAKRRRSV